MKSTRSTAPSDMHGPLTMRVLTDLTERQQFDALLETEHVLGPRFPAGDRLYQVAEQDGQWIGLLLWCAPALHLKDRDTWIGWDPLTRAQRLKLIVNQARFLIPQTARRPNLASQILTAATVVLPDQWRAQCGYAPLLAETFTDPEARAGTYYKAAGWLPVGQTVGYERHRCDFFSIHDHPQHHQLQKGRQNHPAHALFCGQFGPPGNQCCPFGRLCPRPMVRRKTQPLAARRALGGRPLPPPQ